MKYELRCKREAAKEGASLLLTEKTNDNYLVQLKRFLFERRNRIDSVLNMLKDKTVLEYGGDMMYLKMEGSVVLIYNYFDDDPEEFGIRMPRSDLIKILQAWQEINEKAKSCGGINELILQRDEEHICMSAHYEDGSEFRRTFNYKV